MRTLYTMPGFTRPHDVAPDARRTYGADGRDYGYLRPQDRAALGGHEEYDPETDTVTVWLDE